MLVQRYAIRRDGEPIILAVAIITEARTLGTSIKNRVANYRTGPGGRVTRTMAAKGGVG